MPRIEIPAYSWMDQRKVIDAYGLLLTQGKTTLGTSVITFGARNMFLGKRIERAAVRRFAQKLIELCDAHEATP